MLHHDTSELDVEPYELVEAEYETGRFPWMDVVSRRWASLLETTLYERLGLLFEVQAEQVVWMRFANLLQHVRAQPIYIVDINQLAKGLLILDNSFVQATMRSLLPDEGELVLEDFMMQHHAALQDLLNAAAKDFENSWTHISDFQMRFKRVTTSRHRARVLLPHERCLVLRLKFQSQEQASSSEVILALPFTAMHKTLNRLEPLRVLAPESVEPYYESVGNRMMDLLEQTHHQLVSELGKVDLRQTRGSLKVGQVLPLQNSGGKVTVRVNGRPTLIGKMGQSSSRYAVQIQSWEPVQRTSALKPQDQAFQPIDLPEGQ